MHEVKHGVLQREDQAKSGYTRERPQETYPGARRTANIPMPLPGKKTAPNWLDLLVNNSTMPCKYLRLKAPEEALCGGSNERCSVQTFADVQAMHPWFLDYERLEPGIRELVWTLNQTGLVETLSSCEGHPELPDWWETTGGTAYVLCLVTNPQPVGPGATSVTATGPELEGSPIDSTR